VRALLAALIAMVKGCKESLKAQEVVNALFGLSHMGQSPELLTLFAALTPKVEECEGQLRVYQIGDAMRILKAFPPSPEVQQLMAALSSKVQDNSSFIGTAHQTDMEPWDDDGVADMREIMAAIGPPPAPPPDHRPREREADPDRWTSPDHRPPAPPPAPQVPVAVNSRFHQFRPSDLQSDDYADFGSWPRDRMRDLH
jgi:hypothetical protein